MSMRFKKFACHWRKISVRRSTIFIHDYITYSDTQSRPSYFIMHSLFCIAHNVYDDVPPLFLFLMMCHLYSYSCSSHSSSLVLVSVVSSPLSMHLQPPYANPPPGGRPLDEQPYVSEWPMRWPRTRLEKQWSNLQVDIYVFFFLKKRVDISMVKGYMLC